MIGTQQRLSSVVVVAVFILLLAAAATASAKRSPSPASWLSTGLARMKAGRLHAALDAFERSAAATGGGGERARELANAARLETSINLRYCLMTLYEIGYDPMRRERALARSPLCEAPRLSS